MSRFHGPQQAGATRDLRQRRHTEASARQAAEKARDAERRAHHEEPPPLTDADIAVLEAVAARTVHAAYYVTDDRPNQSPRLWHLSYSPPTRDPKE